MIRKFTLPLTALAMASTLTVPAQAAWQEETGAAEATSADNEELAKFLEIFKIEDDGAPIEPDQLIRGEKVAAKLLPDGSYRKIMATTMQDVLDPMMSSMDQVPLSTIAQFAGIAESEFSPPDDTTLRQLMEIIDPYYKERQQRIFSGISEIIIDLSDQIEPAMREGMAKAYARRFSAAELDDVAAFLGTETGSKFGSESLAVFSSREVISASMEIMPEFFQRFSQEMGDPEAFMGDLPPQRSFEDISEEEWQRFAELLGIEREAIPTDDAG